MSGSDERMGENRGVPFEKGKEKRNIQQFEIRRAGSATSVVRLEDKSKKEPLGKELLLG